MTTTARATRLTAAPASIEVGRTTTFTVTVKRNLGGPNERVRVRLAVPAEFTLSKDHIEVSLDAGDTEKSGSAPDVVVNGAFNGAAANVVITATLNQDATCNVTLTK